MSHVAIRIRAIALLSLLMYLPSCHNNRKKDATVEASADSVQVVLQLPPSSVSKLFVHGGILHVASMREPFFSEYDLNSFSVRNKYGWLGRRDGELLNSPSCIYLRDDKIHFFEFTSKSLYRASSSSGIEKICSIPYSREFRPNRAIEMDGTIISEGCFENGRLAILDPTGLFHDTGLEYPFSEQGVCGLKRGIVFQSEMCPAPTAPRFLLRHQASDCFEIFSVVDGAISRKFVNDFKFPPKAEDGQKNIRACKAGYVRCFVDDNSIYLLWSDKSYYDSLKDELMSNELHIFDWNGALVRKVSLPQSIGAFCVSSGSLYGVRESYDCSEIIRISLAFDNF